MHFYTFHIGDYASHTAHLDPLEDIIYRRMLDWVYLHEKNLPGDPEEIGRLIRMRTECERIANVMREFFDVHENGEIYSARALFEINEYHKKSEKASAAARKRWAKPDKKQEVKGSDADAMRTHSERNANQEPRTNNHSKKNKQKKPQKVFVPPDVSEVAAYCKERGNGIDPQQFVDHYEANGWMRGKTKVKNWKACVRTWEAKRNDTAKNQPGTGPANAGARFHNFLKKYAEEGAAEELGGEAVREDAGPLRSQVDGSVDN